MKTIYQTVNGVEVRNIKQSRETLSRFLAQADEMVNVLVEREIGPATIVRREHYVRRMPPHGNLTDFVVNYEVSQKRD